MRLLAESRTDEEYVEAVRAWLVAPTGSWMRHMAMFLLLSITGIVWPILVMAWGVRAIGSDTDPGSGISFLLAYKAGWALALGAFCLAWARRAFHGPRLERLMIQYHDGRGEEGHQAQISTEIAEDEWLGSATNSLRSKMVRWMSRRDFALKARTDQECVALARSFVRRQRKWAVVFLPLAGTQIVLCWMWLRFARFDILGIPETTPWTALAAGLALGLAGALTAYYAIGYFVEARESLRHPRIARLMLKYHDASMLTSRSR